MKTLMNFFKNMTYGICNVVYDNKLRKAIHQKDIESLECLLIDMNEKGSFVNDFSLDTYRNLLNEKWHISHEQILSILQQYPTEANLSSICDAICIKSSLEYLDHDDYGSFYKKCFWAIYVIKTQSAFECIESYCNHENSLIRKAALYRYGKISQK